MKEAMICRKSSHVDEQADLTNKPYTHNIELEIAPWKEYMPLNAPYCEANVEYDDNALYVTMRAYEKNIICKRTERNSDVCADSCMEFFFSPIEGNDAYFNFEVNSRGVMYIGYSPDGTRNGSKPIDAPANEYFTMNTEIKTSENGDNQYWEISYAVPFDFIKRYCPSFVTPCSGNAIRANFYKCADDADEPHYVVWNNITTDTPDYHVPQCFGRLFFE